MRSTLCFTVTICMVTLLHPTRANAQIFPCGNATPINCGDFVNGNGDDNAEFIIYEFACPGMIGHWTYGGEVSYLLVLNQETQVTATADPSSNWNAALGIVGEGAPGICDPANLCIVAADDAWTGQPETVSALLPPGRYYIIVDGVNDIFHFGPFTLEVTCGPSGCVDDDGDGYDAFHAVQCPGGDDCCDAGNEPSLGCTPATDASINPGATEVCEDGIDNDCDGSDDTCPSLCVDDDGDGYDGYHASDCPEGTDCCDTGAEASLGCTPATDASINPGATEVCEDGIDNDCDGSDDTCPTCGLHAWVNCGSSGGASTDAGAPFLNGYCASGLSVWAADEYLFGMVPPAEGAVEFTVTNMGAQRLDAFALEGICDPAPCVDFSTDTGGTQRLVFYATAGFQYSFSVDGRDGAHGPFDYAVDCRNEVCAADDVLACGDSLTGDNDLGSANVDAYPGLAHHLLASEYVYSFTVPIDATVTVTLNIDGPSPPDLALLVIEEDASGNCLPGNLLAASDERQDPTSNPPEVVGFLAAVGTTYFVIVDGWRSDSTGSYGLSADCVYDCPAGTTECFGECVDLNTDVNNCGQCGRVCSFPHAEALCVNGQCVMGPCHPGWADCNSDPVDGCETPLGTVTDCAGCDDLCDFPHAQASCVAGNCVMGPCDPGWADCNASTADGCETPLGTVSDCGYCDDLCDFPHAQAICDNGNCVMGPCDPGWADCNSDPVDGCETPLGTVTDCAGCDDLCAYDHAQAICDNGSCVMGPCDPGWADCNQDPADGCETPLGTLTDCADCDDLCAYDNAQALCVDGVCTMGPCDDGWADCNQDPADGCETPLGTLTDCADCDDLCAFDHAQALCIDGVCTMGPCEDGWADCNLLPSDGCETPLGTVDDCADCDDVCFFANAETFCIDGICVMGDCIHPWADCNQDPSDGCEANLTSVDNCGSCGYECSEPEVCYAGKCVLECPDGFTDCDGSCVDIHGNDVNNCGACGQVCTVANGTPACEEGVCVIAACHEGFLDCMNGYSDGCETILGTDQNCSGCGDVCEPYPNAYAMCDQGECVLGACLNGYGDCNDDPVDGCETGLGTDQNCSECDDACEFPNANGACLEGQCVMTDCHPGWTDCNQDPADGCESDLSSDSSNCGSCGNSCLSDEICVNGQCVRCQDIDGDGHHDQACGGDDCDESDPQIHAGAEEICDDGIDQNCDGRDLACDCHDQDGDGYQDSQCGGNDCDDSNGFIHPDAFETCGDGIDQDCSGSDLPCHCDLDSDGHQDTACGGDDCDDSNQFIHPGAADDCGDGIDQDCDGADAQCGTDGCNCGPEPRGFPAVILAMGVLLFGLPRRSRVKP